MIIFLLSVAVAVSVCLCVCVCFFVCFGVFFRSCLVGEGARPGKQVQLLEGEIKMLCVKARDIFMQQPILLELEAPIKICGKKELGRFGSGRAQSVVSACHLAQSVSSLLYCVMCAYLVPRT